MSFGKLFCNHEIRYMKLRPKPPIPNMTKTYYPKVSIKVFKDKETEYLIDPTGWEGKKYVWRCR
jgi:hypothetical protein